MVLIITAAEVSAVLALSLNDADVQRAQDVIELVTGADLGSPDPAARFTPADLRALRLAVQWEVAFLDAHPEALTQAANVQSVSSNGASVTFAVAEADGYLSPLSARALRRTSYASGGFSISTLRPAPRTDLDYVERPDPWVVYR